VELFLKSENGGVEAAFGSHGGLATVIGYDLKEWAGAQDTELFGFTPGGVSVGDVVGD